MKKNLFPSLLLLLVLCFASCNSRQVELKIVATSDVHGNFYPYDFIRDVPADGSLSRVQTYLKAQRRRLHDRLLYVDGGDILQGQPTAYYYNTVAVGEPHLAAQMLNYMGCCMAALGNHDVETGGQTYQNYILDCDFPVLGANIVFEGTDECFLPPYKVVERKGVRIAFLGMTTPAIPNWLPRELWRGLEFDDMQQCARYWVDYIREHEHPDLLVGLFHSGREGGIVTDDYAENASLALARDVPGFDAVVFGHDHQACCDSVTNVEGRTVYLVNPAADARMVGELDIRFDRRTRTATLRPALVSVTELEPDAAFLATFADQQQEVKDYVGKRIGTFTTGISTEDAFFGPSAFMDFIHRMQLDITGAQVSLAAPLSFHAVLPEGDVFVRDMFNLYKYENQLYLMELTGREILGHLEMSYDLWTNQMTSSDDDLLAFADGQGPKGSRLKNIYYNFDSAAGIRYEVDVTKPAGERVRILSMADGTPFDLDATYRVAVNSYRGNGGGELLTRGAGIPQQQLSSRILYSTEADLRYYLLNYIEVRDTVTPVCLDQWRFVPEFLTVPAAARDRQRLFPDR